MKKLMLLIASFVLSFNLIAQEISKEEWRQMSRQERKEYKEKVRAAQQEELMQILTAKAWVLEAYQLQDRYGETAMIQSSLNFVGVSGDNATAQLGSGDGIGWNGVGGITIEGSVRKYEVKEKKSGVYVRIDIAGASSGFITMTINISADGNASATLTDNTGAKLTYRGQIVALANSTVYKGQVVY